MADVLKQTMEKRKRFTVVGCIANAMFEPAMQVNHVLATDADTARRIAIASTRDTQPDANYTAIGVFAGFQQPV